LINIERIKIFLKTLTELSLLFMASVFVAGFVGIIYMLWTMLKFINN